MGTGKDKFSKGDVHVGDNLAATIKDLEAKMRDAATNLEFEEAARLRDEVKRLKEMELDTMDSHLGE